MAISVFISYIIYVKYFIWTNLRTLGIDVAGIFYSYLNKYNVGS